MSLHDYKQRVVAGDIGGTRSRIGIFSGDALSPVAEVVEVFACRESPDLETILDRFFQNHPAEIDFACIGIAGPVIGGHCRATNFPWEVSAERIRRRFNWTDVELINDLAATAWALPLLGTDDCFALNPGVSQPGMPCALVAPGTGLGMALVIETPTGLRPIASEGGHADFAPTSEAEYDLWRYLERRFGRVSIERVLSGPGLMNIYAWIENRRGHQSAGGGSDAITPEAIVNGALEHRDRACRESLKHFSGILGSVAGNLALTGMTTGGVYIGGGIAPSILSVLKEGRLMAGFTAKGRFSEMMKSIPVHAILNREAPLLGAAHCALKKLNTGSYGKQL